MCEFFLFSFPGLTRIRHNHVNGKICKTILGLDGNALYLNCMSENMPCGMYVRRRSEEGFKKEYPTPLSNECIQWLTYIEETEKIDIQHAKNGGEFRAGKMRRYVDGFCQ